MTDHARLARRVMAAVLLAVPVLAIDTAGAARGKDARPVATLRSTTIPDSYIVVLKEGVAAKPGFAGLGVSQVALDMAVRYGGTVTHRYEYALQGFAVQMPAEAARLLAEDARVAYVEENGVVRAIGTQPNPPSYGLDRIDQRDLPLNQTYKYNFTGLGVHAYMLDTGIRATHQDFGGRVGGGFDAINDGNGTNDCDGHGTHTAGTVGSATYGVAKQVTLHPVRVLDCYGYGTYAGVISGVDFVTGFHQSPAVANMSLGGGASQALDDAVTRSINSGVVYAISAGNASSNACNVSPARTPAALTVGSVSSNDARSYFSNIGPCVDLFAPGSSITSTSNLSDTAFETFSGTSMAAPHVAGVAALVLQEHPAFTSAQVSQAILANASVGRVIDPGVGSPNRLLFSISLPDIHVVSPNGGETLSAGSTQQVSWTASGLSAGGRTHISYWYNNDWQPVGDVDSSVTSFNWVVPSTSISATWLRIGHLVNGAWEVFDHSDRSFAILGASLQVVSPNGGETFAAGSTQQVSWTSSGLSASGQVHISYWYNNDWRTVGVVDSSVTSFSWVIPNTPMAATWMRIGHLVGGAWEVFDYGDQSFAILGGPDLHVVSPNGGETFAPGTTRQVMWTSARLSAGGRVFIAYWHGDDWRTAGDADAAATSFAWVIPDTPGPTWLRIGYWVNGAWEAFDYSDGGFTIGTPTDVIFKDAFDSGDFSKWSSSSGEGEGLSVVGLAMHTLVEDTRALWVRDDSPNAETRYRARFRVNTNGFDTGEANTAHRAVVFLAFQEAPQRRLVQVVLKRQAGAYSVRADVRPDDDTLVSTPFVPIADAPHVVEIDWQKSSAPGANDGALELWVDGVSAGRLTGLDNDERSIDYVRMGAMSLKTGAAGTLIFDDFESRRESYIGP